MTVHFKTMNPDGSITEERTIKRDSMLACPFVIWMPDHYREDESCRCDDPDHKEMLGWGYRWNGTQWIGEE